MTSNLDDHYLQYLYDYVGLPKRGRNHTYWKLFKQMYAKEFLWLLMKDSSREEDGKEFRWEFIQDAGLAKMEAAWLYRPCTVLEMMIAVAKRLAVQTDGGVQEWFIQLLYNMNLDEYTDAYFDGNIVGIEERLDQLVWRTYSPNGEGGLFPLRHPVDDQRVVEIWYQMNAWLIEREREG